MKGKGKDVLGWDFQDGAGTYCGPKDSDSSVPQVGEVKPPGFGGGAAELLKEEHYPEFMGISWKGGFTAAYPVELDVEGIRVRLEREYQDWGPSSGKERTL